MNCRHSPVIIPPEWAPHAATWLQWPKGDEKRHEETFCQIVKALAPTEEVRLLVSDSLVERSARTALRNAGASLDNVRLHRIPTDWCWCRDNGPIFAFDNEGPLIIDWRFTGWTNEPPYAADDAVPARIAKELGLRIISHDLVVEGGALELNGAGTVIASRPCLRDRNKKMNDEQIEEALKAGLCTEHVVWLEIFESDDITNGHPDGIARFTDAQTVIVGELTNIYDTKHHVYEDAAARIASAGFVVKRMPIPGRIKHGHKTMLGEKETSSAGEQLANRCSSCL